MTNDRRACWQVLPTLELPRLLIALFTLHDLRLLRAHAATDRPAALERLLERLDLPVEWTAAGYGRIADELYEKLIDEIRVATETLRRAT